MNTRSSYAGSSGPLPINVIGDKKRKKDAHSSQYFKRLYCCAKQEHTEV